MKRTSPLGIVPRLALNIIVDWWLDPLVLMISTGFGSDWAVPAMDHHHYRHHQDVFHQVICLTKICFFLLIIQLVFILTMFSVYPTVLQHYCLLWILLWISWSSAFFLTSSFMKAVLSALIVLIRISIPCPPCWLGRARLCRNRWFSTMMQCCKVISFCPHKVSFRSR